MVTAPWSSSKFCEHACAELQFDGDDEDSNVIDDLAWDLLKTSVSAATKLFGIGSNAVDKIVAVTLDMVREATSREGYANKDAAAKAMIVYMITSKSGDTSIDSAYSQQVRLDAEHKQEDNFHVCVNGFDLPCATTVKMYVTLSSYLQYNIPFWGNEPCEADVQWARPENAPLLCVLEP